MLYDEIRDSLAYVMKGTDVGIEESSFSISGRCIPTGNVFEQCFTPLSNSRILARRLTDILPEIEKELEGIPI